MLTACRHPVRAVNAAALAAVVLLAPAAGATAAGFPPPGAAPAASQQDTAGWEQDGLSLSPQDNAAVDAYLVEAAEAESVITPQMVELAERTSAELVGLDHRLKTEDSLKRKLATWLVETPEKPIEEALDEINDSVRYTFVWPEDVYTPGTRVTSELLAARRHEPVRWQNTWDVPDGYKAVNSAWNEAESGHRFEVQFHTPASKDAAEAAHPLYEEQRLPSTSPERAAELAARQAEIFAAVPVPAGAAYLAAPGGAVPLGALAPAA